MKMADVIYKAQWKDWPDSYIVETSTPLDVKLREHHAEADNVHRGQRFYSPTKEKLPGRRGQVSYSRTCCYWKQYARLEQYTNKLEQVPDWRMRGIKETITIRSTPHNVNHSREKNNTSFLMCGTLYCFQPWNSLQQQRMRERWQGGWVWAPVTISALGYCTPFWWWP